MPSITVVGRRNLDLVARVERLPRPGETVTGASFARVPGGKGANQAVAARAWARTCARRRRRPRRLRGQALPQEARSTLAAWRVEAPTGVALIVVDDAGENKIVVAPGANAELRSTSSCRRRTPCSASSRSRSRRSQRLGAGERFFCLNAAPARPIDVDADLLVVNRYELETLRPATGSSR